MWGADDPDNRKPMVWRDKQYQKERNHPLGQQRRPDVVVPNYGLYSFHKQLANLRQNNGALTSRELNFLHADSISHTLVYERFNKMNYFLVLFYTSMYQQLVTIDLEESGKSFRNKKYTWRTIINENETHTQTKDKLLKYKIHRKLLKYGNLNRLLDIFFQLK